MNNADQYMEALTKREWYTGQALAGLCANPEISKGLEEISHVNTRTMPDSIALMAINIADATLAELAKEKV